MFLPSCMAFLINEEQISINGTPWARVIFLKSEIFEKFGGDAKNTDSSEGQIELITHRINHLTGHLKKNRKDFNTEFALVLLVGKRRSHLDYLKKKDIIKYRELIKELGIRK